MPTLAPSDKKSTTYTPVPGSLALRTRSLSESAEVQELFAEDRGTPIAREVGGAILARTLVREGYVAVLTDVYDRLALDQEAPEQAVYGHLYRLALGDDRNFCRVTKADLMRRTRLSERRLLKALAGLVTKGHVALVHRDREGTLYRVVLPHEVFGEGPGDAVLVSRTPTGRRAPDCARPSPEERRRATGGGADGDRPSPQEKAPARARAAPDRGEGRRAPDGARPSPEERRRSSGGGADGDRPSPEEKAPARARAAPDREESLQEYTSIGSLAAGFVARFGGPGREHESVVEEIMGRLEEGRSLREVAEELALFAREAPRRTPIAELARVVARVRG